MAAWVDVWTKMIRFKCYWCGLIFIFGIVVVDCVTPPSDMIGGMANINPITGEMEDMEFRVAIPPKKQDCFYQEAKKDHTLEVNYQVIETSSQFQWMFSPNSASDLMIDFFIKDPQGSVPIHEYGKQEGSHMIQVIQDGVYSFCFDNTFSSTKLINVEVYLYSNEDDDRWGFVDRMTFPPEVQYLDTIESIKITINRVRDALNKVVHNQDEKRAIETRDRILAEKKFRLHRTIQPIINSAYDPGWLRANFCDSKSF